MTGKNIFDEIIEKDEKLMHEISIVNDELIVILRYLETENEELKKELEEKNTRIKQLEEKNTYLIDDVSEILKEKHLLEKKIKKLETKLHKKHVLEMDYKKLQELRKENEILIGINDYLIFKSQNPNAKYDKKNRIIPIEKIHDFIYRFYVTEF